MIRPLILAIFLASPAFAGGMALPIVQGEIIRPAWDRPETRDPWQRPPVVVPEVPGEPKLIYEPPGEGKDRPGYAEWVAGGKVKRP